VLLFILALNGSKLFKNWLTYPLFSCVCVSIFVCDYCVLTQGQMALQMDL